MIADFDTFNRVRAACADDSPIDVDAHAAFITQVAYLARTGTLMYARRGQAEPTGSRQREHGRLRQEGTVTR